MQPESSNLNLMWTTGAMMFAFAVSCNAQQRAASQDQDGWQFSVTPYLWMAGQSGTVRVGQVVPAQNVNVHFSNVLSNLDFGVMGTLEAHRDRWSIILDGFYISMSRDSDPILGGDLGTARLKLDNGIVQLAGAYRVLQSETSPVDVYAGVRYTNLNADLTFSQSRLLPAGAKRSDSVDWVDGLIGVRATYKFADRWSVWGSADVGAGGSNYSWQLIATVLWDASKNVSLSGGFRILAQDYNTSSFYYNVRTAGPFVGARIRF
jgi:hypothetical protein